ncbi:MAG: DUF3006 domain-containing protein [Bacillota bacterium]
MKVVIDRFEGDVAVIEWGEATIEIPRGELPAGAAEGSVLTVRFEVDEADTAARRARAAEAVRRLRGQG